MVKEQIQARGVKDARVLRAMRKIPREHFLDGASRERAYEDRPLSIGHGQTISQPYIVARMAELASIGPDDNVLEVGAGSGYQAAVLTELGRMIWAVDIVPALCDHARKRLAELGITNAQVECFDGSNGWPEHAPYDAILVAAGAPKVPVILLSQLAPGGRFVGPIGARDNQRLVKITRRGDDFETEYDISVRFVDLTGRYGWGGRGPAQA
jgi:protein-L-isoaspartate(D-aspartate) O-methyltransferase